MRSKAKKSSWPIWPMPPQWTPSFSAWTPPVILNRLNAELIKAIRNPDIRAKLAGQGAEVVTMTLAQ